MLPRAWRTHIPHPLNTRRGSKKINAATRSLPATILTVCPKNCSDLRTHFGRRECLEAILAKVATLACVGVENVTSRTPFIANLAKCFLGLGHLDNRTMYEVVPFGEPFLSRFQVHFRDNGCLPLAPRSG